MPRIKGKLIDRLILQYGEEIGKRKYEEYREKRRYQLSEQSYIDKFGEEQGKKKYKEYREKTKFLHTKNDYVKRYGEELGVAEYEKHKNDCVRTLETFIKKYGDDEGKRRWDLYCEKQSETNTFEYKHKKYGWSLEQFDEYNKSRAVTLKNMIKRYGEELGTKKWEAYCDMQSYTKSIQYFIDKYGEKEGRKRFNEITLKKAICKENFIRKYGKEEGLIKWNNYLESSKLSYSKISQILFEKIILFNKDKHETFFGENEKILKINKNGLTHVSLDFYNETTNKAIEFYGDYWHANPVIFEENEINQTTRIVG